MYWRWPFLQRTSAEGKYWKYVKWSCVPHLILSYSYERFVLQHFYQWSVIFWDVLLWWYELWKKPQLFNSSQLVVELKYFSVLFSFFWVNQWIVMPKIKEDDLIIPRYVVYDPPHCRLISVASVRQHSAIFDTNINKRSTVCLFSSHQKCSVSYLRIWYFISLSLIDDTIKNAWLSFLCVLVLVHSLVSVLSPQIPYIYIYIYWHHTTPLDC